GAAGLTPLHTVKKTTDPKKLGKYLQKLSALPMTADILAETGIRKTVKSLRKHQHVGHFARDLAAQWKKLLLADPNTGPAPDPQDPEESSSRKPFGEALQDEGKSWGFPENGTAPRSGCLSPEHRRTVYATPTGLRRPERSSPSRQDGAERKRPRMAAADSSPHRAPLSGRAGPLPMTEGLETRQQAGRGHADAAQGRPRPSPRLQAAGADSSRRKTVLSHGFSELWDLSEPWMQANYDLLSAFESMTAQPQAETALSAPTFREEAGSPGRRVNAKMQVYSGSRPARQPQWLTLRQQCVRALRDNPDALGQVGRVPSWVLELVLEGCTPDQLYRREKNNHALIGETDGLWRIHCLQDFKGEKPQERESWRELYLRLRRAREQRLRLVTTNIRAARDNKPNGRQTKMICFNSAAETPYDAPRRQGKSAGAADPENGTINPDPHPGRSSHPPSSGDAGGSGLPSCSNAQATPDAKIRKRAAKKVAPLMAKAVRDYKRIFSRR
uniref:TFIIS N-terminal domain-containing protein n=1 Tax=Cebus imitator TaxID=2715852 RepID=A0A2K5RTY7_CEBIM